MQRIRHRSTGYYSIHFPPGVKWLLIVNVAVFLVEFAVGTDLRSGLFGLFVLVPNLVFHGFVWQLFTYMFLHGGVWHIVINMLMLWMFGADLEQDWGTRRFLKYYFLCGIGAGLCILLMAWFRPQEMYTPAVGASGAIFGLLLAFGVVYADRIILMMLLFPMKAKYAVLIFGAIEFLSLGEGSAGTHIAHLGGMAFGYVYLKVRFKRFTPLASLRDWRRNRKMERARRKFQVYLRKGGPGGDRWVN
jgi:membrane associated rhomboid family serine protease